jgi:hypothetical protein
MNNKRSKSIKYKIKKATQLSRFSPCYHNNSENNKFFLFDHLPASMDIKMLLNVLIL